MERMLGRTNSFAKSIVLAAIDSMVWILSACLASLLRFEFRIEAIEWSSTLAFAALLAFLGLSIGIINHLYRRRYIIGSVDELKALVVLTLVVAALGTLGSFLWIQQLGVPRSVGLISATLFLVLAGAVRLGIRLGRSRLKHQNPNQSRAIIYGAGKAAESLIPQLLSDSDSPYAPVALLDDAPDKSNRWISGIPMAGQFANLGAVAENHRATVLIVAIPSAGGKFLQMVYREARACNLEVLVLPPLTEYLAGNSSISSLKRLSVEDLLGRQLLNLSSESVEQLVRGRKILITGAGGSIGSELAKQIANYSPSKLLLVDRDETFLLEIRNLLAQQANELECVTYLADIRDKESLTSLFESETPSVVFHAAAFKHVAMLERFPREAWKTNVEGTLNLLEAAKQIAGVTFVNISTDKAAKPESILGRSKLVAEGVTAWFNQEADGTFVSVRFGNVFRSRGSLIPILEAQILSGGPVTITDKDATRYFMSVSEACQLVLAAASDAKGGDVLVLDMGEPVRIQDIAERLIELSGRNVAIEYIGLRPGEKLHEDLLSSAEKLAPSSHPRILRFQSATINPNSLADLKW